MPRSLRSLLIGLVLAVFLLLRDDFWLASDPSLVLGLPVGLLYHALYCLAAAGLMAALVRFAPPASEEPASEEPASDDLAPDRSGSE